MEPKDIAFVVMVGLPFLIVSLGISASLAIGAWKIVKYFWNA